MQNPLQDASGEPNMMYDGFMQSLKLAWIYVDHFLGILESTWMFLLTKI